MKLVLSVVTLDDVKKDDLKINVWPEKWPEEWPEKWPEKVIQILQIIKEDRNVTIPKLEMALHLGHTTIKKMLREMQNKKLIQRVGPANGGRGHWEVVAE